MGDGVDMCMTPCDDSDAKICRVLVEIHRSLRECLGALRELQIEILLSQQDKDPANNWEDEAGI